MNDPRELRYYTRKRIKGKSSFDWFFNLSVTGKLILINVAIFIIFFPIFLFREDIIQYIALRPDLFFSGYVWTLLTSMFMHGSIFHILVNMFVLFSLGGLCEKIIGRKRFLWFYLLSGLIAGLIFVFLAFYLGSANPESPAYRIFASPETFAVGASGAIFAIAGLFMILTPKLRFSILFFPFFSLPAYIMIPLVLFGTWIVSYYAQFGIGNTAHFGGFLAGVIYGLYLRQKYKRKTQMISKYFSR